MQKLGKCSKRAVAIAPTSPSARHAELQIGLGTAGDWLAWASRLRSLDFSTAVKRGSSRAKSILESTRFTYTRTAANALFSRDQVIKHFQTGSLPSGEFDRFLLLYRNSGISTADEARLVAPLHATLDLIRHPNAFPWATIPNVRIIDLIYYKYTPDAYKGLGRPGRAIKDVVLNGDPVTSLKLPSLLYASRNWTFHGSLVDSSFRGSPQQYQFYITAVTKALAEIIGGYAVALESAL